jgi:hypothetical protein
MVWERFGDSVLPKLGAEARDSVLTNKDPAEMGPYEAVKIQNQILEAVYSKY